MCVWLCGVGGWVWVGVWVALVVRGAGGFGCVVEDGGRAGYWELQDSVTERLR